MAGDELFTTKDQEPQQAALDSLSHYTKEPRTDNREQDPGQGRSVFTIEPRVPRDGTLQGMEDGTRRKWIRMRLFRFIGIHPRLISRQAQGRGDALPPGCPPAFCRPHLASLAAGFDRFASRLRVQNFGGHPGSA